jgi:hypothetical protein
MGNSKWFTHRIEESLLDHEYLVFRTWDKLTQVSHPQFQYSALSSSRVRQEMGVQRKTEVRSQESEQQMDIPISFWILASESWILVCHVDQQLSCLDKWLL